jgi:hypothetical protein
MSDRKGNDKALFLAVLLSALAVGAARGQSTESHRGPAGDPEALRYVQVNGVRLACRVEGAGSPVVFVHGEGYSKGR